MRSDFSPSKIRPILSMPISINHALKLPNSEIYRTVRRQILSIYYVLSSNLDAAYEPGGREFESLRARQIIQVHSGDMGTYVPGRNGLLPMCPKAHQIVSHMPVPLSDIPARYSIVQPAGTSA